MEETLKSGISTNNPCQLEPSTTINLGILRAQENIMTCKSGALTQDGGNYSSILEIRPELLSISNIPRECLLLLLATKRDKQSLSTTSLMVSIKDGELSILIKLIRLRLRD
jgi:hypothetical protein